MKSGAQHYAQLKKQTGIEDANPHQLIAMLYQGILDNLQQALGFIERKDIPGKGQCIGRAITIIGGLQSFLDHEKGGEISRNLDSLYEYMSLRLLDASAKQDVAAVQEVIALTREIKEGWDGIASEALALFSNQAVAPEQV